MAEEEIRFFSADSHVNEPPEAWERIPKRLREHGPHFVQDPPGKKGLYMVFDGHEPDPVGMTFTAGVQARGGKIIDVIENFQWEDWRGPWDPAARLKDMDLDGVMTEVLYPSLTRNFFSLKGEETELQKAGLVAYNDWIIEYANVAPDRLVAVCILSALDVEWSLKEMERCAKLGHKGALIPSGLPEGMSYADPEFEPLWTKAEDMDFPIHIHVNILQGVDRMRARLKGISPVQQGRNSLRRGILEPLGLLTELTFGGALQNHPRLRVVFAEYDLSWLVPYLNCMDSALRRAQSEASVTSKAPALPSEMIKRQVYVTFQEDRAGILGAEVFNILDNVMWASDYPHGGATWPHSREAVKRQFEGMSDAVERKLTWENAAKFYGIG